MAWMMDWLPLLSGVTLYEKPTLSPERAPSDQHAPPVVNVKFRLLLGAMLLNCMVTGISVHEGCAPPSCGARAGRLDARGETGPAVGDSVVMCGSSSVSRQPQLPRSIANELRPITVLRSSFDCSVTLAPGGRSTRPLTPC